MRFNHRRVVAAVLPLDSDLGSRPRFAGRAHPRRDDGGHPGGAGQGGGEAGGAAGEGGEGGVGTDSGAGGSGDDEFKSEHSKQAVLADLAAARDENKTLKDRITELENANKSEDEKAREQREATEVTARNDARFRAQFAAAKEAGLDLSWVERIAGGTPEEMAADAKSLKADLDARASAGERTDGAGTAGAGGAVVTSPGMGTLTAAYNTSKK
ncbi:hypothetical protein [Gordonia sp. NB41Y]|uniref:hypothetical protein n=1 Tax=Gordonia sp. NB41Y TaxID=875808 RepID=UPI0003463147|nr:hypothetical protein [Gordonia sp. NB41Y]EMP15056.2 hypothetical protein ISGA_29 [Gordonia sp. NB41Y]WLP91326.1 hypothetical protein Q9K23_03380 [Gordonia sp. NB41Y]